MWELRWAWVFLLAVSVGCAGSSESSDASDTVEQSGSDGSDDGQASADQEEATGAGDGEPTDTDEGESDDLPDESGSEVADGFGVISGSCGVIDAALRQQPEPILIQNAIDFDDDPYDDVDYEELTDGGREIISDGNAGGSSLYSEVFAFEVLTRCEGAVLLKTETEILYEDSQGKMTALLVSLDGVQVGVSVTRAVGFPREDPYTVEQAQGLLEQKLDGILASSANVTDADGWDKQILHIIAYAPEHAESLRAAFELVDPAVQSNTIVYVTVSDGEDSFLY